jgi:hypothetical protein
MGHTLCAKMTPPPCRFCGHPHTIKAGKNNTGQQRYKCKNCTKRFLLGPLPAGVKPVGDHPLPGASRQKKWRDSLTPEQKLALTAKKTAANQLRRQRQRALQIN